MCLHQFELSRSSLECVPGSLVFQDGIEYAMEGGAGSRRLILLVSGTATALKDLEGECSEFAGKTLFLGQRTERNAAALRQRLPWLRPNLLGPKTSVGLGDRLGMATPGHVRAVRASGTNIAPIFAQQSMREMTRTGRTAQQVMDDATWGIFEEGWRGAFGADADHLKTPDDIDACLAAGFTFFTIDPGAFVDARAETASLGLLRELADKLPADLQPRSSGLLGRELKIEKMLVNLNEPLLLKAAVKYGGAVAHVAAMCRHLVSAAGPRKFEIEVSVDETEQPTSHSEHIYIASELRRQGVNWASLAPRFVGRFEKGVDYIGKVDEFEADISGHAAIARHFGNYKLSLHSGSDKFSIYPSAMRQTNGLVHLKTAGTSYLEALRTVASLDIDFLRDIYVFARAHYEIDRASYHVSAELGRAPLPDAVSDGSALLDQFDAREILHVTFGSVLTAKTSRGESRFGDYMKELLHANADAYAENLETHFARHLRPFAKAGY